MPRLSEVDKEALCKHETDPTDNQICKREYDFYSDYQDLKQAGKFTGDFNAYKKSIGFGVVTWGAKPNKETSIAENSKQEADTRSKRKKVLIGFGIGAGVLILAYIGYRAYKNKTKN